MIESITDEVGYPTDHGLLIERSVSHPQGLNGSYELPTKTRKWEFNNFRPEGLGTAGSHAGYLPLPPLDINALRLKLLANSNPSRADADLAVTIGEMKNAPKALFGGVRDFVREVQKSPSLRRLAREGMLRRRRNPILEGASGYLGVQFGLLPLIRDVQVVMTSQERIANRLREIANLRDGDGIRKKLTLENLQVKGDSSIITISSVTGLAISATRTQYASRRVWGTVRWKPDPNWWVTPDTDRRRWMEARRATLGLQFDLVSAYNLMPWSWLIDYFSSVGDFLNATRNVVGAVPGNTNIMAHTIRAANIVPFLPAGITGGSCLDVRESKERFVGSGFTGLNSTVPILSNRQVSILGALAITRLSGNR